MDVDLEQLMSLSLGSELIDAVSGEQRARGDESVFISREVRSNPSFQQDHPTLHRLIKSIEDAAIDTLSSEFQFNTDMTSVQLARYPGDGCSAYSRHCDSGASCRSEQDTNISNTSNDRVLTFVYYLTPNDWDAELDGGALRVFSSAQGNETEFDIIPFSDRLVVFRSDYVEHQVLPSLRRERIAITVWLYKRNDRVTINKMPQFGDHVTICDRSKLPPPLPMPESTTKAVFDETIFVVIPSYRDSETWPTILSLLQTAHNPDRISIGVVWQVNMSATEEVKMATTGVDCLNQIKQTYDGLPFKWKANNNFRSLIMDYMQATGKLSS
jgi:predicted 2-oxoglutarate/Fe(II)-dependent dioxygenase YbiX